MSKVIAPPDKLVGVEIVRDSITEGGIVMPASGVQSEAFIELISIGSETKGYNVGDVVIINPFSGKVFSIDRITYRALFPSEVYCIVKD